MTSNEACFYYEFSILTHSLIEKAIKKYDIKVIPTCLLTLKTNEFLHYYINFLFQFTNFRLITLFEFVYNNIYALLRWY